MALRLWRRALALMSMVVSGLGRSLQPTSRAVDPDFEQPLMDPTFTHTVVGAAGSGGVGKSSNVEDMGRGREGGKVGGERGGGIHRFSRTRYVSYVIPSARFVFAQRFVLPLQSPILSPTRE